MYKTHIINWIFYMLSLTIFIHPCLNGEHLCVWDLLYLVVLDASELLDEGTQGFSFSLRLFTWCQLGPVGLETKELRLQNYS